ncbi:MAG: aminotransferase class I/II-fold pyridoxal phosphate-dependent enzyme [Thermoguttaceae bacterium]
MSSEIFSPTLFGPSNLVELVRYRATVQHDDLAFVYLANGIDDERLLTNAELDRRSREIAAQLQYRDMHGKRVLLLFPPGLDFITAFFGCLYAGAIAVPVYPPRKNRSILRIQAIAQNAQAAIALTTLETMSRVQGILEDAPDLKNIPWLATDQIQEGWDERWTYPDVNSDSIAFLQYTSGSTGTPKGVVLSHGNLIHNSRLIQLGFEHTRHDLGVFWLPSYHDMGLIGGILQPIYCGRPNVLMSPLSFLQSPFRWLAAITRYRGTTSGGPNFAYDLCVRKIRENQIDQLDLSSWKVAFNGAEPVQAETLETFARKFERCGFKYEAFYPCFGLAEATLMVTGGYVAEPPCIRTFNPDSISNARPVQVSSTEKHARRLVSSGRNMIDQVVWIVNPETGQLVEEGTIGEIWVKGPSVAQGYWQSPETTKTVFRAKISPTGEGPFMRTGDLGFFCEEELFVTGRIKDLIIIRGVNVYPQDIEATVQRIDPNLRVNSGAAVMIGEGNDEHLVVVQELERRFKGELISLFETVRKTVALEHELIVDSIVFVKSGSIPKTSSGKIQRHAVKTAFLDGTLTAIEFWNSTSTTLGYNPRETVERTDVSVSQNESITVAKNQTTSTSVNDSNIVVENKNTVVAELHTTPISSTGSPCFAKKQEPNHFFADVLSREQKNFAQRLDDVNLRQAVGPRAGQSIGQTSGQIERLSVGQTTGQLDGQSSGQTAGQRTQHPFNSAGFQTQDRTVLTSEQDVAAIVLEEVRAIAKDRAVGLTIETDITELGLDSLERMEILASLEDRFGGQFPEHILPDLRTAREVVSAVLQHLGSGPKTATRSTSFDPKEEIGEDRFRFSAFPEYQQLKGKLDLIRTLGLNHFFDQHEGITNDRTMIRGKEFINFSSYNYINTSGDPRVTKAAQEAVALYGTSVSASRMVSGEKPIHRELEERITRFLGTEDTIVMVGGHSTNESVIGHLLNPDDMILHDALAHNSIVQGAILSGARRRPFPHNDWEAADWILKKHRNEYRRVMMIVEGVYSMDGDYPELPKFIDLRKEHKTLLMIDEAHSMGVLGKTGRGIGEHFKVNRKDVDVWMCTLSKTFGSCGGYISGSQELVEYLKYTVPGFVFSVGLSPPNTASALAALKVLEEEPNRVEQLRRNSALFLKLAKSKGLNTGMSRDSAVVPVIIGNSMLALQLSKNLFDRGINVQPILHPAVEEKAARLRFFITSAHNEAQIRFTVDATAEELNRLCG